MHTYWTSTSLSLSLSQLSVNLELKLKTFCNDNSSIIYVGGQSPDREVSLDMKHGVEAKSYEEVCNLSIQCLCLNPGVFIHLFGKVWVRNQFEKM